MSRIDIRRAKLFDVYKIHKLEKLCFQNPWSFDSLFTDVCLNNITAYVVAENEGDVIAYAGVWIICGEAHVTNIAVHPLWRKKGLGRKMVNVLEDIARKNAAEEISLEVRQSNQPAISLYSSEGFETIGVRNKYYTQPTENALIMRKLLLSNEQ